MKKMFLSLFFIAIAISSCSKDDSLDPRPVLVSGQFVKFDIKNKILDSENPSSATFGGVLSAPGNKVVSYKVYVRLYKAPLPATDFKFLREVTQFPSDLYFTAQDIATALNIPVAKVEFSTVLGFYGEAFDADGNRFDFSNLSTVIRANSSAYKHAFRFNSSVLKLADISQVSYDEYNNWEGQ